MSQCRNASATGRAALVVAAGATLALLATSAGVAQAQPVYPSAKQVQDARAAVGDKASQVAAIQGQLAAASARLAEVQVRAEIAAERYNGARVLLEQRTRAAQAAAGRAKAARAKAVLAQDRVGMLAAMAYTQGGTLGGLETFLSSNGPQDVIERASAMALVGDIRKRVLAEAAATSVVAGVLERQAARAQAQQLAAEQEARAARAAAQAEADTAARETARIQQQQTGLVTQLAVLQNTSVALQQQRQAGLKAEAEARARAAAKAAAEARAAEERRRERAAAARQAAARAADRAEQARQEAQQQAERERRARADRPRSSGPSTPRRPGTSRPPRTPPPSPPRPSGGVSSVIAFAQAQLGEWYLWGGTGPDRWDCSGLTQAAWRQAGVNLTHYSVAQYGETRHVPISERRPGDLLFYGPSPSGIHHVALYIGNDRVIEAPHTGAQVRNASMWRSELLPMAGRP